MSDCRHCAELQEELKRVRDTLDLREEELLQFKAEQRKLKWVEPMEIGLTKFEARLLKQLYLAQGNLVNHDTLLGGLYPNDVDIPDGNSLEVLICRLRKKMKLHGVIISNIKKRGYRLDETGLAILKNWGRVDHREDQLQTA